MKKYILVALLLSVGTISLNAQDKKVETVKEKGIDRITMMVETLTKTYDLSDEQITKAKKIYEESDVQINKVKDELLALRTRKVNLNTENKAETDAFNADYKDALEARKSVLTDRDASIDAILTDEQKAKVKSAPVKSAK